MEKLNQVITQACQNILSHQTDEGYWLYTLEANESIPAEFIFLMHYTNRIDQNLQTKIALEIINQQNPDGSWSLFHQGLGDLSSTVECYFALKLAGYSPDDPTLQKAKKFILTHGGIEKVRIFTRIHLALFGLIDWTDCPNMPIWFILFPDWFPIHIYEFSSWARATIVPLLVLLEKKKVKHLDKKFLDELALVGKLNKISWQIEITKSFFSIENFFLKVDSLLHFFDKINFKPFKKRALRVAEKWIIDHLMRVEDIYPLLAYSLMALDVLDKNKNQQPIEKAWNALLSFQIDTNSEDIALVAKSTHENSQLVYQQCCISPVWDTAWAGFALRSAGIDHHHPQLIKASQWLLDREITFRNGDWKFKNPEGEIGGWAFEFENDYFPDVDDTMEVCHFLKSMKAFSGEKKLSLQKAIRWLISMQSSNGGFAAFDKNNNLELVNRIPFSDHGACLDEACPDLTARAIEFLASEGYTKDDPVIQRSIRFIENSQHQDGGWWARWAVNYIFGTWCVLEGLMSIGYPKHSPLIQKAIDFIKSVQNEDGGFGESPLSYNNKKYTKANQSNPSQTAWGLMALMAVGEQHSIHAQKAVEFLINQQNPQGGWDEKFHTGTGFPEHFYIRYHGYRHYFPLLALARFKNCLNF